MTTKNETPAKKTEDAVDNFIRKPDKTPQFSDMDGAKLYKRIFEEPFGITYQQFTGATLRFLIEKCMTSLTLERSMCFEKSKFFGFYPGGDKDKIDGYPVAFAVKPMTSFRSEAGFGCIGDINKPEFGDVAAVQLFLGCIGRSYFKGINFEMVEDVKPAKAG